MALFKRADLEAQGLSKEQIDFVMTEGNRSLSANYALKSDIQSQIDAAVAAAKPQPIDVKTSQEYLDIAAERDMLRAIGGDDFATVKPKFRETVYKMLDRSSEAASLADQLETIGEKYEEYFVPEQQAEAAKDAPKNTPQYSQQQGRTGVNPASKEDELYEKLKSSWK